jgi:hypothetical protein
VLKVELRRKSARTFSDAIHSATTSTSSEEKDEDVYSDTPPPSALEEEKVMVQTISKQFVSQLTKQAIANIIKRNDPEGALCTNISICKAILKSGKREGEVCSYPLKGDAQFCRYHTPKGRKIHPEQVNGKFPLKPTPKPYSQYNWLSFTEKNKVVPEGGKRISRRRKPRSYKKYNGKRRTMKRKYNVK